MRWFRDERGLSRFVAVALAAGALGLGPAANADLLVRSPFMPDDFNPGSREEQRQANQPGDPLSSRVEFRGFYRINGEYRFLIKEKDKPAGRWVRMDDPAADFIVQEFDPEARSVRLRFGDEEGLIELVRLDSNPTPMAVSGQPPIDPARDKIRQDAVASNAANNNTPTRASASTGSSSETASRGSARRRTPPPPPQWLQDRLAARGLDVAATMDRIGEGPPNFIPPPPPKVVPPPPPGGFPNDPGGGSGGNNSGGAPGGGLPTEPPRGVPGSPPAGLPPGGPPGLPPDLTPPPPPRR